MRSPISRNYVSPHPRTYLSTFTRFTFLCLALLLPVAGADAASAGVTWINSTADEPWQRLPDPSIGTGSADAPPEVQVAPGTTFQTIDGFGGCFNELGWVALSKASELDRKEVLSALFGNHGGGFTLGRIPIGCSDYALDAYSLDDTPGDVELRNFSIARDRKQLLPYVQAAMAVRPALRCWGSPWTPPAWMKTNGNYSKGSPRWEPPILHGYATYLARWVDAYRAEGVDIFAITPQNEPNIRNVYPTCDWSGAELREFIADYLGPTLRDRKTNVELWLGLNGDALDGGENPDNRLAAVLNDPVANHFLTGIAYQYDNHKQLPIARQRYPDKKFMQSESVCGDNHNSWADAQKLYGLMKYYFDGGVSAYYAWNMVLDETGESTWKWPQNALITVNRSSGKVTYNGEYYVMRHFSEFVKPGAKRVETTGTWGDKIAFVNPDGSTVLVVGNALPQPYDVSLKVAGRADGGTFKVKLPPASINTFIVGRP